MTKKVKKSNRKNNRAGVLFTALVLLILVSLTAWRLKEGPREEPPPGGEPRQEEQEEAKPEQAVRPEPKPEPEPEPEEPEEKSPEQEKAEFLPDYTSAPLLHTTEIRSLSMEVGASGDEVRFNWLSQSGGKGSVMWKNTDTGEEQKFEAQSASASTVGGYYVNKASVTGIQPGASYTYRVGNEDAWSPEYTYRRPKESGRLTFLVTSDAQIGQSEMEEAVETAERWDSVVTRLLRYVPEAEFLFHLGDHVADAQNTEQYELFLDHLALYRIPLAPIVGNHDIINDYGTGRVGGRNFYEHFNVPNRSDTGQSQFDLDGNYYFVRGETLFIVLNSSTIQSFDVLEQYVAKVVQENPDVKWRILAQHFSPYSSVSKYQENNDSQIREYLARAAMDNNVDLVLSGHEHIYARSAIINRECETLNDYNYEPGDTVVNPQGTLYVTCGTSSGCLYHPVEPEVRLMFQNQENVPTALRIDITDTELHLRAYLVDFWTVCDEYTIRKE